MISAGVRFSERTPLPIDIDPMRLALCEEIRFADFGVHIVLLDLRKSRYFALPRAWNEAFRHIVVRSMCAADQHSAAAQMVEAGLFEERDDVDLPPSLPQLPSAETSFPSGNRRAGIGACFEAFAEQRRVKRKLRNQGLSLFLSRPADQQTDMAAPFEGAEPAMLIASTIRAIQVSAYLVSQADNCLVRSLALATLLRRRNIGVQCVLGVTVSPFSAHAWVQRSSVVLGDTVANVRRFKPIMLI